MYSDIKNCHLSNYPRHGLLHEVRQHHDKQLLGQHQSSNELTETTIIRQSNDRIQKPSPINLLPWLSLMSSHHLNLVDLTHLNPDKI